MSMFQRLGNQTQQPQQQSQDPRSAAMELMRKQGIDVPQGMENDPSALLQHVLQSGKVPQAQNRLSMAQQMMQRMFGGRR
ncbi:MAG: hypothetical protein J6A30_09385 [Ruminococcus sp.]|nr:hypothetical protein [Ruminococcus sp.]